MTIAVGTPVHVLGDMLEMPWGMVTAATRSTYGYDIYQVRFETGAYVTVGSALVDDVTCLGDRPRACFTQFAGRA